MPLHTEAEHLFDGEQEVMDILPRIGINAPKTFTCWAEYETMKKQGFTPKKGEPAQKLKLKVLVKTALTGSNMWDLGNALSVTQWDPKGCFGQDQFPMSNVTYLIVGMPHCRHATYIECVPECVRYRYSECVLLSISLIHS